ncbi:nicotinate-nucleotide--dimethylbenzimidazole phosphoribosyltransferase [Microaerobacter geothermalis]|uniref:nicotinate-nucleotide--dimethylbenzimidazole phosphoribosyltransferase n=1 Tax=Microaerobacter geothermalis TaxID=674972 RepID=UPI001F22956F|nr:nicotinate-nucleotide--dimethylbenzimidazole phosphoribosyltransferase [Microaerobacter geothermalis]MCF6095218.1 nicotinate-nucleotide--dimethylbenzimidazole phosphoribosyltransferase [Microaerobacter geothermalis]
MTEKIDQIITNIKPLDQEAMEAAFNHINQLTKPQGSLGQLENIAIQLAGITGLRKCIFEKKSVVVMAGDHGVVEEGVSAFPKEVTVQMVFNFLHGGAAINVMAREAGAKVTCVDVGVDADLSKLDGLINKKVMNGTANMVKGPAMTRDQALRTIEVGIEMAEWELTQGTALIATGEMGIGNTTASSAMLAALSNKSVEEVVGRGTGIDDARYINKVNVIKKALQINCPNAEDPIDVLHKVGGLEIGAMAGLILGCAANRIPVVIDGFISTVAALTAVRISPAAKAYLIPSHKSVEPGHQIALQLLDLNPSLHMNMRLGEGTGACLMFSVIDTVQRIMNEMATFEQAGVSTGVVESHD